MMKISLFETKKLFIGKEPMIFMLIMIIMSVFFNTRQQWEKLYSYDAYAALCKDVLLMESEGRNEFLSENAARYEAYHSLELGEGILTDNDREFMEEYNKNRKDLVYTNNYWFEAELFGAVKKQYEIIEGYNDRLDEIFKRAENLSSVSVFGNKNSFEMKNIRSTAEAYKNVMGVQPQFSDTVGVKYLAGLSVNDILLIVSAVFGAYFLVMKERISGALHIVAVTKKGKLPLALSKVFALFLWCIFCTAVFFAVRLTAVGAKYDLSAAALPVQSVEGYINCPYPVSAAEYIGLWQIFKLIAAFICSLLFSLTFIAKRHILSVCGGASLIVAEIVLFSAVDSFSIFGVFKYFNLFALLDFSEIGKTFHTVNFFGQSVNAFIIISAFALLFIVLLTIAFTIFFSNFDLNCQGISFDRKRLTVPKVSIFAGEMYRSMIINFGAVVLLLLSIVSTYNTVNDFVIYEPIDRYYEQYLERIKDSSLEQVGVMISKEESFFDECGKRLNRLSSDLNNGTITSNKYFAAATSLRNELARAPALQLLKEQYEYICQNLEADFVYYKKVEKYMNLNDREAAGIKSVLYMQLSIILTVCPIFLKFSSEENKLISSTPKGGKKLLLTRLFATLLIALTVFLCVDLPQIVSFASTVSLKDLSAAIQSLVPFREAKADISIGNYFILLYFIRFAAAEISALTAAALCTVIKNKAAGYIVCSCLLVLPEIVYFLISKSFSGSKSSWLIFFAEGNLFLMKIML